MTKQDWKLVGRGVVGLPLVTALVFLQKFGRWLDGASDRRFDALMDWMHGNKSWREQ